MIRSNTHSVTNCYRLHRNTDGLATELVALRGSMSSTLPAMDSGQPAVHSRRVAIEIGVATFAILVLELAIIRWMSQQIRVFAYLNNLLLIAAFLGMGIGLDLSSRGWRLIRWKLPLLLLLAALLAYSKSLNLMDLSFPDVSIALWGADGIRRGETFLTTLAAITALFGLVASVFVCGGEFVGQQFARLAALRAYSADLLGSFLGVAALATASYAQTTPVVWFAIGCVPVAWLSRKIWSWPLVAAILWLVWGSQGAAMFSPYNRIDLRTIENRAGTHLVLAANRDFHQFLYDLSDRRIASAGANERPHLATLRAGYDLPFALTARRGRALVVGAGTGNDVAAALRAGFAHVTSVDIDPRIIEVGRALHPERPYSDARTVAVVNDARNFFENYQGQPFDIVCFGLLDSHAMFSAMSTLRLDNYVYTVDGIRAAYGHVAPGGTLSVSFQVWQGEWLADRIAAAMKAATGQQPWMFGGEGRTFVVAKGADLAPRIAQLGLAQHQPRELDHVRIPDDDWPFLYLRPGVFPVGYAAVLSMVLIIGIAATRFAYGAGIFSRARFDVPLFLMGAAFLLIETRGVTGLSLLFGSTWIVNSAVFGGVLLVAWIANLLIERHRPAGVERWFVPLLLTLLISYAVRPSMLLGLDAPWSGIIGSLVNAAPIGFAAVIFSALLRNSADSAASLGSNLLGAVAGGCLEYLSLYTGLRSVTLVAAALYLLVLLLLLKRRQNAVS